MKGVEHTRIEIIDNTDQGILENIFQFYLYDMSEFTSSPTNLSGKFSFDIRALDDYWKDTNRTPY
ncbi:hypothetical protein GCM10009038_15410 [Salinicola rhizosphaerae]|uniref:Uncharacterized protein n=1 Tax=Salinicola rhizosphaerae TaxID=1443141 RepID=A0ABQ3DVB3_9GAMM|nr:hypothetical protein GCM10009038_15410 [Salinicola rhizosphaerae]